MRDVEWTFPAHRWYLTVSGAEAPLSGAGFESGEMRGRLPVVAGPKVESGRYPLPGSVPNVGSGSLRLPRWLLIFDYLFDWGIG
jgi:hypothetical protein